MTLIGHNGGPTFDNRWYQDEAVETLIQFCLDHRGNDEFGRPLWRNPLVCLPTGTGKSVVIANFLRRALLMFPSTRAIMSTHVKELIEQNAKQMLRVWPQAPLGIYSAGLGSRDAVQPLIFGGVQSMVNKYLPNTKRSLFQHRDFLIIDEAHLLNDEGRYIEYIKQLQEWNPYLKIIGFTATPYRLGLGIMTNGNIFTDIVYDLCNIEGFNRLMAEGYLCPLYPRPTNTTLDVSSVGLSSRGDFNENELQAAVDKQEVTFACLKELVEWGLYENHQSWLIFASGVEHAEHITEMLNTYFNIPTVCIHSKTKDRDEKLKDYKAGVYRCAVTNNVLTTGFDHAPVSLIGMMRPTISTGLWVQMLGRGTRPYSWLIPNQRIAGFDFVKAFCRVLDFAGNTRRLGPINDPIIPKPKSKGPPGEAPIKTCKTCGNFNHTMARVCLVCGAEFPERGPDLTREASTDELIKSDVPQIEYYNVDRVVMVPHVTKAVKKENPGVPTAQLPFVVKVVYYCGTNSFFEFVTVEGNNFPAKKGRDWWRQRYPSEPPMTNAEVLQYHSYLRPPSRLRVWVNKKYPEVMGYEF